MLSNMLWTSLKAPVVMSFFVNIVLGEALRPSLQQLCANVLGHLNTKGLYPSLKVTKNKALYCNSTVLPVVLGLCDQ